MTFEHRDHDAEAHGSRATSKNVVSRNMHVRVMYVSLANCWPYLCEIMVMVPSFLHSRKGLYSDLLLSLGSTMLGPMVQELHEKRSPPCPEAGISYGVSTRGCHMAASRRLVTVDFDPLIYCGGLFFLSLSSSLHYR